MPMCDHIICNSALSKGYGLLEELESKLSASKVRDLELLGYIENAVDSQGETWKLTGKGKKLRKLLMDEERKKFKDTVKDWIYLKLLKFNVNL